MVPFKKAKRRTKGARDSVCLASVSGNLLKQILKKSICKHWEEERLIKTNQHEFAKNRSHQTNLISLFDKISSWVEKEMQWT